MGLFDPFPELSTARLRLRALRLEDAAGMLRLDGDARVNHYIRRPPLPSLAAMQAKVAGIVAETQASRVGFWVMEDRASGAYLGSACLWNWAQAERQAELGYVLDPARWGEGLTFEAMETIVAWGFEWMELRRVEARIHPGNLASIRVATRLGLRLAPELRGEPDDDGVTREVYVLTRG